MENAQVQTVTEEWEESNREDCEEMSLMDMCSWAEAN